MSSTKPDQAIPDPRDLRVDYRRGELLESQVDPDPIRQFNVWFTDAVSAGVPEANAMTLATTDDSGAPDARIMLLKEVDAHGFTFFTNYDSRKGRQFAANPRAALVFHWITLERQVRVYGDVEKVSREAS